MNISELLECLDEKLSIDEKIVSKKALKRKRRAAKKAAKKAIEKEQSKASTQDSQDTNTNQQNENIIKYELIALEDQANEHTEEYNQFMLIIDKYIATVEQQWSQIEQEWKREGSDKGCPKEVLDKAKQVAQYAKTQLEDIVNNQLPKYADKLHKEELIYLHNQLLALQQMIEGKLKLIDSIMPVSELAIEDKQKSKLQKIFDTKKYKTLIYSDFEKAQKGLKDPWEKIKKLQEQAKKAEYKEFRNNLYKTIIEIPVVTDIFKAIMYSNPFTAFLLDGVKVKCLFDNIKNIIEQKGKKKKQPEGIKEDYLDQRGLPNPKYFPAFNLRELEWALKSNQEFVDYINVSYNHSGVSIEDKASVKKLVNSLLKNFKNNEDREDAVDDLTTLVKRIISIADYMEWNTYKDLQNAQLEATGNTDKESDQIAAKDTNIMKQLQAQVDVLKDMDHTDNEIIKQLTGKGYSENQVKKALKRYEPQQESLLESFNKLLEEAQR